MIFHPVKVSQYRRFYRYPPSFRGSNEKETAQSILNQKILDAILDDDEKQFSDLIMETNDDLTDVNKTIKIANFKIPEFLEDNPTYACLCACFSAERCFTVLSMLSPGGAGSQEMMKLDDYKRSPIHFACIGGSLDIIRKLDQAGFDMNLRDNGQYLPSHYAAMSGHFDVMKYLWTKGANVLSLTKLTNDFCVSPIHVASLYGNLEIVKFICETVLSLDTRPSSEVFFFECQMATPMHYACIGGHDNIVNYFLSIPSLAKEQINALDSNSRTPLLCACHNGNLRCVKAILNYKKEKINLSMKGRKHLPLVDASESGFLDIVQFLVKEKGINIQQETSQKKSALDVAVVNDHLDIVKCLIDNGASKNFDDEKVGNLMFTAFETGDYELVRYLDNALSVPYHMQNKCLEHQCQHSKHTFSLWYRMAMRKDNFQNLTYGDRYMQQACLLENKEMIDLLLEKNCNFNQIDITDIIRDQSFSLLSFLIEKGLNVSSSNDSTKMPPIVPMIKWGSLTHVKELLSKGAVLDKDIILKYKCVQVACEKCDYNMFNFLMSYQPDLTDEDLLISLQNAVSSCIIINNKDNQLIPDDNLKIIDILLNKVKVDFDQLMPNGCETYISFAASRSCFQLLDLFEKHGANFIDCSLNFDFMTHEKFIHVFNYFKERGCTFQNGLVRNKYYSLSKKAKNPLQTMFRAFYYRNDKSVSTLLFMLDYSKPNQIKSAKFRHNNLIDILMGYNCYDGVLKAFKLVGSVFYPLCNDKDSFVKWVKNSNNQELIDFVFKNNGNVNNVIVDDENDDEKDVKD